MKLCDKGHDEVCFSCDCCPVCEARNEIERHELYQEEMRERLRQIKSVLVLFGFMPVAEEAVEKTSKGMEPWL